METLSVYLEESFRGLLDSSQTSTMELLSETINYFRKKSSIVDVQVDSKYASVFMVELFFNLILSGQMCDIFWG